MICELDYQATTSILSDNIGMVKQLVITERELRIRNYSRGTMNSYLRGLKKYFHFKRENFYHFDEQNVKDFLLDCEKSGG